MKISSLATISVEKPSSISYTILRLPQGVYKYVTNAVNITSALALQLYDNSKVYKSVLIMHLRIITVVALALQYCGKYTICVQILLTIAALVIPFLVTAFA